VRCPGGLLLVNVEAVQAALGAKATVAEIARIANTTEPNVTRALACIEATRFRVASSASQEMNGMTDDAAALLRYPLRAARSRPVATEWRRATIGRLARPVVEHLRLCGWRITRPEPKRSHSISRDARLMPV
jgi:hypothetical protein